MKAQKMKKKTTFIIDRSKWRCGGPSILSTGESNNAQRGHGDTRMRNVEGYMCCLGQIAEQLGAKDITDRLTPSSCLNMTSPILTYTNLLGAVMDNDFSERAMEINDNANLTDIQRERKLERLAEKYGLRIEFTGEYVYP